MLQDGGQCFLGHFVPDPLNRVLGSPVPAPITQSQPAGGREEEMCPEVRSTLRGAHKVLGKL